MNYTFRWRKTSYGPLAAPLQGRFGQACQLVARGRNGNMWIEFADGFRACVPQYAIRRAA
jgi:hypothetical protein